jgi:hypothetical protein
MPGSGHILVAWGSGGVIIMRRFGLRKIRILIAIVALAVAVGIPTAVMASSGGFGPAGLNEQQAVFTTTPQTTSSTGWQGILTSNGNDLICALGQVTGTLSVQLTGAPAGFRIVVDGVPLMQPGAIRFVPAGNSDSSSFTFVASVTTTGGRGDEHSFDVQWHSATGKPVTLVRATVNFQYQLSHNCGG